MPQFTLTANACAFTGHGDGVRCRQHEPLKTPLAVEHLGARNCDELAQALRAFHGGVGLRYDGSYLSRPSGTGRSRARRISPASLAAGVRPRRLSLRPPSGGCLGPPHLSARPALKGVGLSS